MNVDPDLTDKQTRDLVRKYRIQIPMMLPNQKEAIRKYGADRLPRLVVIGQNKKVTMIITGFDQNLEAKLTKHIQNLL